MYNVAKLTSKDRKDLFDKYVSEFGGSAAVVEKDFWVTLMLDYLFNKCQFKDYFVFKGGTSLSKCYNLIDRFSEDIDLTVDHNLLGISDSELDNASSKTARLKLSNKIHRLLGEFIKSKLKPTLEKDFASYIDYEFCFQTDNKDDCVLNFYYPNIYVAKPAGLLQCIRLEMGAIASMTPNEEKMISPLVGKINTPILEYKEFFVKAISPIKTFWEKVLILHQEANRPLIKPGTEDKPYFIPLRYSRHYYDVWRISQTEFKELAKENVSLLFYLIHFKDSFYHYSWNHIDEAVPGKIKLIPSETRIKELEKDYSTMKEMINDKSIDSFRQIITKLRELEKELNDLKLDF